MFSSILTTVPAVLLIGGGLIVLPLPIPLGGIMILSGVCLAVATNPAARRWVRRYRARSPRIESMIGRFRPHLPGIFHKPLDDSHPDAADDDPSGR